MKIKTSKRSRAAILPTPGDPYINGLWMSSYKKIWRKEVDKLYVCVNSGLDFPLLEHVASLYRDLGCHVELYDDYLAHGVAIQKCLLACEQKHVLLLEDDFYILSPDRVDDWFYTIEWNHADVVASLRASCCSELHKQIVKHFGLTGPESLEPNFWPCLLLTSKENLLKTTQHFDSFNFEPGKNYPELNWTPTSTQSGDTFVKTSIELRNMNLRFYLQPQYRNTTDDLRLYSSKQGMFSKQIPWTHFGSSSTSLNGTLLNKDKKPLGQKNIGYKCNYPDISDPHLQEDYERRLSLWLLCREWFPLSHPDFTYFNDEYSEAIEDFIQETKLDKGKINSFKEIYEEVLKVLKP